MPALTWKEGGCPVRKDIHVMKIEAVMDSPQRARIRRA